MDKWLTLTERLILALPGALILPAFEFLYGRGDIVFYSMLGLAFFILLDWISGSRAAKKDHSYASKYGIDGIFRTFFMILLPAGGNFLDMALGLPPVFFGLLVFGLLYHTIQSCTANAIRAGWGDWVPEWVLARITEWVRSELESKLQRSLERNRKEGLE